MDRSSATNHFPHYSAVHAGTDPPFWWQSRFFPVAEEVSWENHDSAVRALKEVDACSGKIPNFSLLDLKIALAETAMRTCTLCPHRCGIDRMAGQTGYCGVDSRSMVHWDGVLYGEERELVPSHEVFFSGCTMRCAFCYSHDHIENPYSGREVIPLELAGRVQTAKAAGAANWNVVGGEPTVHLLNILKALRTMETPQPLVWNSNMYIEPHAMKLLDGIVDLYLGDIHFGNPKCSRQLGKIPHYLPSIQAAFTAAVNSGADVVIRHLVMPGHVECCAAPAMEWSRRALPDTPFHLMFQYLPDYRAEGDPVLGRPLNRDEITTAQTLAEQSGVRLYQTAASLPEAATAAEDALAGDFVDIFVHDDGRVSFHRLTADLLPLTHSLITQNANSRPRN